MFLRYIMEQSKDTFFFTVALYEDNAVFRNSLEGIDCHIFRPKRPNMSIASDSQNNMLQYTSDSEGGG